ncbi:MAG: methyltransferase domain-containing protein, partial [archaeon]
DYTAKEIEKLIIKLIEKNYNWTFGEDFNLNISLMLTPEISLCGASLKNVPMHVDRKIETVPGSIKSSLANVLINLSELKATDSMLDPMCGSGIIAIESAKYTDKCIAGDIDKSIIHLAKKNSETKPVKIEFHIWDAKKTELAKNSIDKIISNLPLGKLVKLETEFYSEFIAEMHRISKNKSRWVFLTNQDKLLKKIIKDFADLSIINSIAITNSGLESTILVIEKA